MFTLFFWGKRNSVNRIFGCLENSNCIGRKIISKKFGKGKKSIQTPKVKLHGRGVNGNEI